MIRMLNNRDVSNDSANNSSSEPTTPTENNDKTLTSTPRKNLGKELNAPISIKRNLFGMQLDHDQLKNDLNSMWKDQIEMKKQRWNFDFEKMKPLESKNNNEMKWNKITVNYAHLEKEYDMTEAAISATETTNAHFRPIVHSKSSDEISIYRETTSTPNEENNANCENESTVPHFYQFQRRYKLNENKNRMNLINTNTAVPVKATKNITINKPSPSTGLRPCTLQTTLTGGFNDENAKNIVKPVTTKANTTARKPRALKRSNQLDSKSRIITFSENRKDTLRSATTHGAPATASTSNTTVSKQVNVVTPSARSAFTSSAATSTANMKQQSLLDMFKQRKPRKQNADKGLTEKVSTSNDENARSGHFLRSQSATSQRY
jgi:hypothetical protein